MAEVTLNHLIEKFQGEMVCHSGYVFRKKCARDEKGKIINQGIQECYKVTHPRDFEKTPPVGNEKANMDLWKEACRRTALEIQPDHEKYAYWQERYQKQLTKPDPLIQPNKKTKKRKSYYQFDCFVRVAIRSELVALASDSVHDS